MKSAARMEIAERSTQASPRRLARATGLLSLLTMLTGVFAQGFVSERLVNWSDAAGTAKAILSHRVLYQTGFAVYLIEMACQVAMTALFYVLLKPAGRTVSLVAAFIGLAGGIIKTMSRVFFLAPLFVLGGAPYLKVFNSEQLQALALLLLRVNDRGAGVALVFFGFYAILTGWLILRSTFLPRILGALSIVGGAGWLSYLYLPLAHRVFPFVVSVALLGALALAVWLLTAGVDEAKWKERAAASVSRERLQ